MRSTLVPGLVVMWLVVCSCEGATTGPSQKDDAVRVGMWGGTGIRLDVTAAGAQVEYDCAHGRITERMVVDREGRFDVRGTHTPERGGPIRDGDEPPAQAARYTGQVQSGSMTLTVMLPDAGQTVGRFILTEGSAGRLRKCL